MFASDLEAAGQFIENTAAAMAAGTIDLGGVGDAISEMEAFSGWQMVMIEEKCALIAQGLTGQTLTAAMDEVLRADFDDSHKNG